MDVRADPIPALAPGLVDGLTTMLGDRFTTSDAIRHRHGQDESFHRGIPPQAVAFAQSTDEVAAIVKLCDAHDTPMIPFGTGTSLEGGIAAVRGGISIDVAGLNSVIRVSADDLDCTVGAGVTRKQLNAHLRDLGLFFPIDPGADASLGGMAATRASGTNAVRYGTMRENVLGVTAVLADGRVATTGTRARKSAAGYDLTRLMVGSEGTLGIITEVTLRLAGMPEAMSAAVCSFPSVKAAVDTVILTIQSGIPVARIELLDRLQMEAVNAYAKLDYADQPTLFLEFHGTHAGVREQAEMVGAFAGELGGSDFRWTEQAEDRNRLWQARHDVLYATKALMPGAEAMATDVCVPISRLADCIVETEEDIRDSGLIAPIVGHVGDGNFHLTLLLDPNDPAQEARCMAAHERLVRRALAMGGTCTGEHGIGYGKMGFLEQELGPAAMDMMRAIKRALDPKDLMNPGKIVTV